MTGLVQMHPDQSPIGLLQVARYEYPVDFSMADRDFALMRTYRLALGPVWLIVQSPNHRAHVWVNDGIHVHYVPRRGRGFVNLAAFWGTALVTAWRLMSANAIRLLEANDLAGAFALIPVRLASHGSRLLLHLQFQFFEMLPDAAPWWKRWLFRVSAQMVCRHADSIRCVSDDIRRQAIRAGVDERKLTVIPVRCDAGLFDPARVPTRSPASGRELIYVGALTRLKGVRVLLAAMPEILQNFPDARLRIVGDGPCRRRLEQLARKLGVSDRVVFTGSVRHVELPALLAQTDIFIQPSLTEAMGRAILEAMAMARPVVASRVGGIPEVVQDGVQGILVPPGDARSLAAAVVRVLKHPQWAWSLGLRGRERVVSRFSFEENIKRMLDWHTSAFEPRRAIGAGGRAAERRLGG